MIDELGFSANSFARGLKTNKSYLIGVVVDSLEDMLQAKIVTAMETVFRRHGYACLCLLYTSIIPAIIPCAIRRSHSPSRWNLITI